MFASPCTHAQSHAHTCSHMFTHAINHTFARSHARTRNTHYTRMFTLDALTHNVRTHTLTHARIHSRLRWLYSHMPACNSTHSQINTHNSLIMVSVCISYSTSQPGFHLGGQEKLSLPRCPNSPPPQKKMCQLHLENSRKND